MSLKDLYEIDSEINPLCPYCEQIIDVKEFIDGGKSLIQKISKLKVPIMTKRYFMTNIFYCPHCRKILGISKSYMG